MKVPDRIVVRGNDQHYGTTAIPRELQLESAVIPQGHDSELVKMQTPPRSITLGTDYRRHTSNSSSHNTSEGEDDTLMVDDNYVAHFGTKAIVTRNTPLSPVRNDLVYGDPGTPVNLRNHDASMMGVYDEEVEHLRDQLGRLNRRVLTLEDEMNDRKEKERYIVIAGILYAAVHAVTWLFRSGHQR